MGEDTTAEPENARAGAAARARVLGWLRRSIGLIPTPWIVTALGGVALATTAGFGGLDAAPVAPTPEVAVGEAFEGAGFEMTVQAAELRDDGSGLLVFPDETAGERVLVVTIDATNVTAAPRACANQLGELWSVDGIRIDGIDGAPSLTRADDGTGAPILQPDVPARLLAAWVVGSDDLEAGDEIVIELPDATRGVGKDLIKNEYWYDAHVGATVTMTLAEAAP
ncbi:hypothetical protein [Microbacterium sp.]|uniref:hypothetical protein n=1 Tax=Microbacterium sp. TaxID=51671 RepID=UPI0039E4DDCC